MPVMDLDKDTEKIIEKYGRRYKPAILPADIERGVQGICFDWCALQAVKNRKYTYVEGIALDPDLAQKGIKRWILHAWLTDGKRAYDPTWNAIRDSDGKEFPLPTVYLGIPMAIQAVVTFMRMTGYQGVLANRWRLPGLVDDILEEANR